eukprot:gene6196-1106_t
MSQVNYSSFKVYAYVNRMAKSWLSEGWSPEQIIDEQVTCNAGGLNTKNGGKLLVVSNLNTYSTIKDLKSVIEKLYLIPFHCQKLMLGRGPPLSDLQTVSTLPFHIRNNHRIILLLDTAGHRTRGLAPRREGNPSGPSAPPKSSIAAGAVAVRHAELVTRPIEDGGEPQEHEIFGFWSELNDPAGKFQGLQKHSGSPVTAGQPTAAVPLRVYPSALPQ